MMGGVRWLGRALPVLALVSSAGGTAWALDGGSASMGGSTGYWNTPSAEVTPDAAFRIGYDYIDRKETFEANGRLNNEVYFFTAGFLPRVEVSVRATVFPGQPLTEEVRAPAADRMGSGKILLLREGRAPAVAVGIDDVKGTRRFHSLYAVATKSLRTDGAPLDCEFSAGFGSHFLKAARHVLNGPFGALEIRGFRAVSGIVDYDSRKWNAGVRVVLFRRLAAQAAYLGLDALSGGASYTWQF